MESIRDLLLAIEDSPVTEPWSETLNSRAPKDADLIENLVMLEDAGFITAKFKTEYHGGAELWDGVNLTWSGHDFLAAARDPRAWQAVKDQVGPQMTTLPLEILKALLIEAGKRLFGI